MMAKNQPASRIANQDTATIRALSSITSQQADTVVRAVRGTGQAWDVQVSDDYDGYLSMLVQPTVQGDEQKTLFIAGTAQRLELLDAHGDDLVPLASFSNVEDLSTRLVDLIGRCLNKPAGAHPSSFVVS